MVKEVEDGGQRSQNASKILEGLRRYENINKSLLWILDHYTYRDFGLRLYN